MKANNHIEVLQTMRIMYLLMMVCCAQALEIERLKRRNGTVDLKQCYPVEPVGVIVLGIDGLRQDVLYETPSYTDPQGCVSGNCYVDAKTLPGLSQIMTDSGTIKLKDVTAIFPSITFASWASILSGKQPNETGIVGNEFFARDLYAKGWNYHLPGLELAPPGMVTLDQDGGAFKPTDPRFAINHVIPAEFPYPLTLRQKLLASAPNMAQQTDMMWNDINSIVASKYSISSDNINVRCDTGNYECRTVSIFNQYPGGADWWGTAGRTWANAFEGIYTIRNKENEANLMDNSSARETTDFIGNYFSNKTTEGKRKRFPSVMSVYLAGLDHYAHGMGMAGYKKYFMDTTDSRIADIVRSLFNQGEFDNKIFIIVADHGHTAMPTDLKYVFRAKTDEGDIVSYMMAAEMSCSLKLDFADPLDDENINNAKEAEQANNSLHIWELGNLFEQIPSPYPEIDLKVLAPTQIASVTSGATADINQATVIAALNGPMAHIYVKGANWASDPDPLIMNMVTSRLIKVFVEGNQATGEDAAMIDKYFPKLGVAVDAIMVRRSAGAGYERISGSVSSDYMIRIANMNHSQRSGDIVVIMKDKTTGSVSDRYSTGYACKSWHGSLNPSDSYVPFIVAYPGGNSSELKEFIDATEGCSVSGGCDGNWRLPDLINQILKPQYSGQ